MLDPQNVQMIAVVGALGFLLVLILCLFYGVIQLAKIRRQAVGINQRLDELLSRTSTGMGSYGGSGGGGGMSL
jgi:flagellar biogenesis protein FliO